MIDRGYRYSPAQSYVIPNVCVHKVMCTVNMILHDITYLIFIERDITQHVAAFILEHHIARRWGRKRSWTVVVRGPARMSRLHQNQHVEAPCDIELVLESSEVIGLAFRLKSKLQRYCRSWDTSPERTRAGPGTPEGFFNSGECNAQVFLNGVTVSIFSKTYSWREFHI